MYHPLFDQSAPPRVYRDTAPPPPPTMPLQRSRSVDVAIIGAGFTGLSAALHLAEAGISAAVLEAKQIGWGASGRAFGQVVPYLKRGHEAILRCYGVDGQHIIDAVGQGPALVFELIDKHHMNIWTQRSGLLFAAHSPSGRRDLEERTAYWRRRGAPVEMLYGYRCAEFIGSSLYVAASLDRRGGNLNPLAYARGLARAAIAAGATIYTDTQVSALRRNGALWSMEAGPHDLIADTVIIATNAYGRDLFPGLGESIIAVRGHGFVTEPLFSTQRRSILPEGQSLTDTRHLFSGVRLLPDGRLQASAHGPLFGREHAADWRGVDARILHLYPQLAPLRWSEGWSGWVAMTIDQFPRLHELAPGVFAALGCNGRGIAAATMLGRDLAALVRDGTDAATVFPLVPLRPLRWHRVAPMLVRGLAQVYRLHDIIDEVRFLRPSA